MAPRQQAGHMTAINLPVRLPNFVLASKRPSAHGTEGNAERQQEEPDEQQ
jgi:hypothetical protein